jgi:hypothetical protein
MIYALASMLPNSGLRPSGVINSQTRPKTRASAGVKTMRVAHTRGGRAMDIPQGAKVYSLDGKLIAERKAGAPAPLIRRNGIYIIKINNSQIKETR